MGYANPMWSEMARLAALEVFHLPYEADTYQADSPIGLGLKLAKVPPKMP